MSGFLQKASRLRTIINQNGGIIQSVLVLFRTDELKWGTEVGHDKYGNRYFQNKEYFIGRSRWVDYSKKAGWDYDGSQVPGEWHQWLHYMTDDIPTEVSPEKKRWIADHVENVSGTSKQYVPYSTTKPKVEAWNPSETVKK